MVDVSLYMDLLSFVDTLRIRPMFGGHGVYCGALMFGLIDDGVLYFKVDDTTRPAYGLRDSGPFAPIMKDKSGQPKPMLMNGYWRVPEDIIDDAPALRDWANAAIAVSRKAPVKKTATAKLTQGKATFCGLSPGLGPGLSKVSTGWLREIGIKTLTDLKREGAILSYQTLKARYPSRVSLNLLWGLYALVNDLDPKTIDEETKSHLKSLL
jgi:DNA transformation protein and related proteins